MCIPERLKMLIEDINDMKIKINWSKVWDTLGLIATILLAIVNIMQGRKPNMNI